MCPSKLGAGHEDYYGDVTELPALHYLVRCRVVEFQDWSVPRHTSDDGDDFSGQNSNDEDDSNHNRRHPGMDVGDRRMSWWGPKSARLAGAMMTG